MPLKGCTGASVHKGRFRVAVGAAGAAAGVPERVDAWVLCGGTMTLDRSSHPECSVT